MVSVVWLGSLDQLGEERRASTASPDYGLLLVGSSGRRDVNGSGLGRVRRGGGSWGSRVSAVQLGVKAEVGAEGLVGLLHVSFEGVECSKVEFVRHRCGIQMQKE